MFKSNPNFNEYYGIMHQANRKSHKIQRTQSFKEKISLSKKSFSQDSLTDGQTSLHKRNQHLQDFMNRRNQNHTKNNDKVNSPQSPKQENILDLFKRKDITGEINLRKSVDLYPEARSKKYARINYNQNSQKKIKLPNPAAKYQLAEYFGDSFEIQNKRSNRESSRSRSFRNRSQKSPLRMMKSKSRQQLYSPVQKMLNIIKQEEKVREQKIENQKTIKHIKYICTLNELNETHMNYPALRYVRSEKNFNDLDADNKSRKNKHNGMNYQEMSNSKNAYSSKRQLQRNKSHSKGLKNSESQIVFQVSNRNQQAKKISSSKIKKYFNRKEQMEKDKQKMRNILQSVGTKKEIAELRKIQSQRAVMYSNSQSNDSEVSQSMLSNKRSSNNYKESEQGRSYNSRQSNSQYQNESVYEYSEYGFDSQGHQYQQQIQNKNFYKTPLKKTDSYEEQRQQVPKSPAGLMIDQIKSFQTSKFKEFINDSDIGPNQINSMASIEEKLPNHKQKVQKQSCVSEKSQKNSISIKSSQCQIKIYAPSNPQYEAQVSVNTPAYRHNLTQKKPKQSIISKLKKDIAQDKKKSGKKLKPADTKISQKSSQVQNKDKLPIQSSYLSNGKETKKQSSRNHQESYENEFQNTMKIESKKASDVDGLSNIIRSRQDYEQPNSPPQLKHADTWKECSSQLKPSNIDNQQNSQLENTQSNNGHDLSDFQSVGSKRKKSKKTYKIDSMINSNKISEAKSHESVSIKSESQLSSSKKSSIIQGSKISKKEVVPAQKPQQEKKPIKFIKIVKKIGPHPAISTQKVQESNLESLTDSYQTDSISSSQTTNLISNTTINQSLKFPNQNQKINIDQSKSKVIRQESGSEAKSSPSSSSIDMSSSSSVYTESVKKFQEVKKRISDSEYSESSQSKVPTSKKIKQSKMSQSEHLNTNSQFSLQISSQNGSNTVNKSSSLSSASKKFATANKFNKVPKSESNMFKKKKNFAEYTLNDVARFIEQHEFRIEAFCFYIDNSKSTYEEDYQLQKIQLLSFLMLKKNVYELNRAIFALQGKGQNVFHLTDIDIIDEVLEDYRDREEITQQLNNMIKYQRQNIKELRQTYFSFEKKYNGQNGFNLTLDKDDFSRQIVKKLGQQLNMLYQKWQKNKSDGDRVTARKICQKLERRMIEIIELIFLTSEIDGKSVKSFEMAQNQIQFVTYYEKWYERIIETIEYFDSKSKYSN